ncbi:hypothetical protein SPI_06976 [Niveomyces insectorum RCEF 264]|uniref:Uncharacterized protein n=1 Tax=Niveomyces insectorum RCEF 264 TaxID=1081102 RepID=A0A167QY67_9HYPO|nr:hypothetical protein SPI_06976 [Niveomyces insectorum RCEF 264]
MVVVIPVVLVVAVLIEAVVVAPSTLAVFQERAVPRGRRLWALGAQALGKRRRRGRQRGDGRQEVKICAGRQKVKKKHYALPLNDRVDLGLQALHFEHGAGDAFDHVRDGGRRRRRVRSQAGALGDGRGGTLECRRRRQRRCRPVGSRPPAASRALHAAAPAPASASAAQAARRCAHRPPGQVERERRVSPVQRRQAGAVVGGAGAAAAGVRARQRRDGITVVVVFDVVTDQIVPDKVVLKGRQERRRQVADVERLERRGGKGPLILGRKGMLLQLLLLLRGERRLRHRRRHRREHKRLRVQVTEVGRGGDGRPACGGGGGGGSAGSAGCCGGDRQRKEGEGGRCPEAVAAARREAAAGTEGRARAGAGVGAGVGVCLGRPGPDVYTGPHIRGVWGFRPRPLRLLPSSILCRRFGPAWPRRKRRWRRKGRLVGPDGDVFFRAWIVSGAA